MADMKEHPRHGAKVASECAEASAEICRFFIKPFTLDDDGGIMWGTPPPQEKVEELTRDIDAHERAKKFWAAVAPVLPR